MNLTVFFLKDSLSIVSETENGKVKTNIPYCYEKLLVKESLNFNDSNRAKRLAQEIVTISNSLPISYGSTVFVRCDEERLDVMKVAQEFKLNYAQLITELMA